MSTRRGRCSTRTQSGENKRQAPRRSRVTWAFFLESRLFRASKRDCTARTRSQRDRSSSLNPFGDPWVLIRCG
ncbi:hypothetical protein PUN28_007468 [Cardiocondyla obscurior]|uniref:Uncharacterized protein n=1 Tax=Cardiocondyla obscurior TaxID=286306 RepID=A0AAW2G988_9HYME